MPASAFVLWMIAVVQEISCLMLVLVIVFVESINRIARIISTLMPILVSVSVIPTPTLVQVIIN